jgi:hypothetical protein
MHHHRAGIVRPSQDRPGGVQHTRSSRLVGSEHYRPLVKLRQPPVADSRAVLIDGIDLANSR